MLETMMRNTEDFLGCIYFLALIHSRSPDSIRYLYNLTMNYLKQRILISMYKRSLYHFPTSGSPNTKAKYWFVVLKTAPFVFSRDSKENSWADDFGGGVLGYMKNYKCVSITMYKFVNNFSKRIGIQFFSP